MSVLIKDMKMPEKGFVHVRLFADGRATMQNSGSPFYNEIDVVEIPVPHGDLIDRDALGIEASDSLIKIRYKLAYAPTIIEAERRTNDNSKVDLS